MKKILFFILLFISIIVKGQNIPIILINGDSILASTINTTPTWLPAGATINICRYVKSISII